MVILGLIAFSVFVYGIYKCYPNCISTESNLADDNHDHNSNYTTSDSNSSEEDSYSNELT